MRADPAVMTTRLAKRSKKPLSAANVWLSNSATSATRFFRLSSVFLSLETCFSIGQWAALALIAQAVFTKQLKIGELASWLIGLALVAASCKWLAHHYAAVGRRSIARHIQRQTLAALLPRGPRIREVEPAAAAQAMLELADDVAQYHAKVLPLRQAAPVIMVLIFGVTAWVSWPAAVVLLLSSSLVPLNMILAGRYAQDSSNWYLQATERLEAMVLDSFRGLHALRNLHATKRREQEIAAASQELNRANMDVLKRAFISSLIMDIVITFSIAVDATYIGLSLLGYVHLPGVPTLNLFSGFFILLLCPMYFTPLRQVSAAFHDRERALSAASVLEPLHSSTKQKVGTRPMPLTGAPAIRLKKISYQLPTEQAGKRMLFDVPDLTIATKQWTVLTGQSGSGKTTLLSLLGGLRQPTTGTISWRLGRSQVPRIGGAAWVGQDTVILEDTVAENIRLGRAGASDKEVQAAAEAAGLGPALQRLPNGLQTVLGDNGWGLSTGEARRVTIARALLSRAKLWLLDEPTAHLDEETETEILQSIKRITKDSTVVIATHAPAVIDYADAVLVLEHGCITKVSDFTESVV